MWVSTNALPPIPIHVTSMRSDKSARGATRPRPQMRHSCQSQNKAPAAANATGDASRPGGSDGGRGRTEPPPPNRSIADEERLPCPARVGHEGGIPGAPEVP